MLVSFITQGIKDTFVNVFISAFVQVNVKLFPLFY